MEPDRQIEIQLGHMCNNRCVFCVSGQRTTLGEAGPMPAEPILEVGVEPTVGADQETVLLLHRQGESHAIPAWRRSQDTDPVRFPVASVGTGTYRMRIQVDGAESLLETDSEGRYVRPQVTLP